MESIRPTGANVAAQMATVKAAEGTQKEEKNESAAVEAAEKSKSAAANPASLPGIGQLVNLQA